MRTFSEILKSVNCVEFNNGKYYNLCSLYKQLNESEEEVEIGECIFTPYYLLDTGILEIYDYELNIRVVSHSNVTQYLLNRTGKPSIDEIEEGILEKLISCYIEIETDKKIMSKQITDYIKVILESSELRDRILTYLSEFHEEKLYFEIY